MVKEVHLILTDTNQKEFEEALSTAMAKPIDHFKRELITIRTGRAHPGLVEDVNVSCYDGTSVMRIRELATISAPEARILIIQPWDKGILGDIEKAIFSSDLGVSPVNDGNIIRIVLPEMSADRREELVKILHKKLEDCKIAIRNIRKEYHNLIRDCEKKKTISEDHKNRLEGRLQAITDKHVKELDSMALKKEQDIKTI